VMSDCQIAATILFATRQGRGQRGFYHFLATKLINFAPCDSP
jgi:hypothetical protein